jgi:hypothetical protein
VRLRERWGYFVVQNLTVSREGAPPSIPTSLAAVDQFFLVSGLGLVFLNLLTFGYNLSGSNLLNVLGNAVSLLLVTYSIYVVLAVKEDCGFYKIILVLACVFAGASFLANLWTAAIADSLKYLSIYTFYIAGRSAPGRLRPAERRCIYALVAMPLIFMLVGQTKVYTGREYRDAFAYFPNTNTAALYFSALFFCLSQWFGNKVLVLQFINAALMNRVGPALATILAIGMWSIFPLRRQVFVALFVLGIASFLAYALGSFDRLLRAFDSIALIWSLNPSTVARMSYKDLVIMTGTTDMSAFFRVIHWTNIWELYSTQGLGVILFGYGAGQTGLLAYAPMPPHNDYLRILAEYGLLSFLVFVFFVLSIATSIKLQAAKMLFTVLLIYFFSENLIDNFTSMALFFSYAGRLTSGRSSDSGGA